MSENLPLKLPKQLFAGKTVVITGASRGVGRATALRFAQAGANVAVNYLKSEQDAGEVVELCRRQGTEAIAVRGDASRLEDAEKIRQAAIEAFGRVDILVVNAGIWKGAAVDEMSEELWDEVLDTNLKSGWAMSRAIVPEIKKQERGAIVLVSSTAGQRGEANYSNYAASKGGQISFTKALAMELAPKIRVNCVAPGWIETAMVRPVFEDAEYKEQVLNSIPLKRMAATDDIALAICFLASDWARHITGEILNINGGSVLCG
ncbi:MAG TPA: 3-oxoacyl-ACP reductase family protein [Pyrinomonadaceae bacterium]|jgi:3-oxoacyl-[acyl-carrier protein] reductase